MFGSASDLHTASPCPHRQARDACEKNLRRDSAFYLEPQRECPYRTVENVPKAWACLMWCHVRRGAEKAT
jgi:hypothetical protein